MPQQTLDILQLMMVFARHKTCGAAGRLHPSGATDAMDIIFRTIGQIEIDHVADVRDIDPSGGNIRCDQHTERPASKTLQRGAPLRETPVTMQHGHSMTCTTQHAPKPIGSVLRPGEDQCGILIGLQ